MNIKDIINEFKKGFLSVQEKSNSQTPTLQEEYHFHSSQQKSDISPSSNLVSNKNQKVIKEKVTNSDQHTQQENIKKSKVEYPLSSKKPFLGTADPKNNTKQKVSYNNTTTTNSSSNQSRLTLKELEVLRKPIPKLNFEQDKQYYLSKLDKNNKLMNGFVSYASSTESLAVSSNKKRIIVFINGIKHEDERSPLALRCKEFLNLNLKKQRIFIEKLGDLADDVILANVYLDPKKTINIADIAKKHNFHESVIVPPSEDDLIIPNERMLNSDYNEYGSKMRKPKNQELMPYFDKHKNLITAGAALGLLVDHGHAPYKFNASNNDSYYAKIKTIHDEIVLWGQDLEHALLAAQIYPGDLIKYYREDKYTSSSNKKTSWNLDVVEKSVDSTVREKFFEKCNYLDETTSNHYCSDDNLNNNLNVDNTYSNHHEEDWRENIYHTNESSTTEHSPNLDFLFNQNDNPFIQNNDWNQTDNNNNSWTTNNDDNYGGPKPF